MKKLLTCLLATLSIYIFADKPAEETLKGPWFTGPLLTPSATCLDPGVSNIQPYIFYTDFDSKEGSHTYTLEQTNYLQFGILQGFDLTCFFHLFYNQMDHLDSFGYGDTSLYLGIQLANQARYIPSVRLLIGATFPTGKYRNLNPDKLSLDSMGEGAFTTKVALVMAKVVYFSRHPINLRLYLPISIPSLVLLKGFNAYGGGFNTYGKIRPSYVFSPSMSIEISFTHNWAYAMDIIYEYDSKTSFSGSAGTDLQGKTASNLKGPSQIVSISPAIEYNVNENFGFIGGVWFTLAAKNSSDFVSYVFSFTYSF